MISASRDLPKGNTCTIATTMAPTTRPITADAAVLTSQASTPPTPPAACVHSLLGVVHEAVGRVPAERVGAEEQDVAADPQHRDGADDRQRDEQFRHRRDQAAADPLGELRRALREASPTSSIFTIRATTPYTAAVMTNGDDDEDDQARPERLVGHLVERDDHDLGGQDEVGADRSRRHLLLGVLARRRRSVRRGRRVLESSPRPSRRPRSRDRSRRASGSGVSNHGRNWLSSSAAGRMNSSLLRSDPIAMRLIIGSSRSAVIPCTYCGVTAVSSIDDACGLGGGAPGGGADVVDRRGREAGQRGHVVEKSEQPGAHRVSVMLCRLPTVFTIRPMSDSIQPRAK